MYTKTIEPYDLDIFNAALLVADDSATILRAASGETTLTVTIDTTLDESQLDALISSHQTTIARIARKAQQIEGAMKNLATQSQDIANSAPYFAQASAILLSAIQSGKPSADSREIEVLHAQLSQALQSDNNWYASANFVTDLYRISQDTNHALHDEALDIFGWYSFVVVATSIAAINVTGGFLQVQPDE